MIIGADDSSSLFLPPPPPPSSRYPAASFAPYVAQRGKPVIEVNLDSTGNSDVSSSSSSSSSSMRRRRRRR